MTKERVEEIRQLANNSAGCGFAVSNNKVRYLLAKLDASIKREQLALEIALDREEETQRLKSRVAELEKDQQLGVVGK